MELTKQELYVAYSQGLLEEVLKNAPAAVKDAVSNIVSGVRFYKEKYDIAKQDLDTLQVNYNNLTALSAGYLRMIQQQKEQIDQLLIEQQRPFHHQE